MATYGEIRELEFYPLVKAAPVITDSLDESMCVAGIEREPWSAQPGSWVRIFPVPFRDLADSEKFRKYERVRVKVRRDNTDRRAESWRPALGGELQILADPLSTADSWSERRALIESVAELTMCELIRQNGAGHGDGIPSLAAVRPAAPPELKIVERDREQLRRWQSRADAVAATPSLFDDPAAPRRPLEVIPWRFQYAYRCLESDCRGHTQTIVDWELIAFYQRVKNSPDWRAAMTRRWRDDLWTDKDSLVFVGNQHQHPQGFLILGVFWPPARPFTPQLWNS